jgi:hypothetical protein
MKGYLYLTDPEGNEIPGSRRSLANVERGTGGFDGQVIDLTVAVVSTEYDVELLEVCAVKKVKGARK